MNAAVYLGRGRLLDRGFVKWTGDVIGGVGPMSEYDSSPGVREYDLGGCLALPGLVDCHIHLVGYAHSLIRIDLSDTASIEEGLERIAGYMDGLPEGAWLRGRGWDKQRWGMEGFPDKTALDRVSPRNPVALWSRDGHLLWVNSLAMAQCALAGVGEAVFGGEIERGRDGGPTGIIKEHATRLIMDHCGGEDVETTCRALARACRNLRDYGLTGVHTSENDEHSGKLAVALERGLVDLSLFRMLETDDPAQVDHIATLPGVECVKVLADGALGSQTASMLEPYCGSDNMGILAVPADRLYAIARRALDLDLALAIHAIGDRANREVLDVYEGLVRAGEAAGPAGGAGRGEAKHKVLRLEHVQLLHPDDIERFGHLGVIASMQPIHLVSDIKVADKYWGQRSRWAYAWGSLRRGGATLAFGSDAPIEEPDPLKGIHAAVTRRNPRDNASGPWYPEECIEIWEAIDAYTLGAACASGTAGKTGALEAGYRADITLLDRNILLSREPDAILETAIAGTVAAGHALIS